VLNHFWGTCFYQPCGAICSRLTPSSVIRPKLLGYQDGVVCKIAEALFLVPNLLLQAIPLDGLWVHLAVPAPVIWIAGAPFLDQPGIPGGIQGPWRYSGDDDRRGSAAGKPDRCTRSESGCALSAPGNVETPGPEGPKPGRGPKAASASPATGGRGLLRD